MPEVVPGAVDTTEYEPGVGTEVSVGSEPVNEAVVVAVDMVESGAGAGVLAGL